MNESTIRRVRSEYVSERERHWTRTGSTNPKLKALLDAQACDAAGYEWVPEPPKISPNLHVSAPANPPIRLQRPDGSEPSIEEIKRAAILYNACGDPALLAAELRKVIAYLYSYMLETREIGERLRNLAYRLDGRDA